MLSPMFTIEGYRLCNTVVATVATPIPARARLAFASRSAFLRLGTTSSFQPRPHSSSTPIRTNSSSSTAVASWRMRLSLDLYSVHSLDLYSVHSRAWGVSFESARPALAAGFHRGQFYHKFHDIFHGSAKEICYEIWVTQAVRGTNFPT